MYRGAVGRAVGISLPTLELVVRFVFSSVPGQDTEPRAYGASKGQQGG